jgi:hypothetical protein
MAMIVLTVAVWHAERLRRWQPIVGLRATAA